MEARISFASLVKEEAAKYERTDEEKKSVLSAFIRINGYLRMRGNKTGLELSSENSAIAKCVYQYLHDLYGVNVRFAYTRSAGLLKRVNYHVIVDDGANEIIKDLEIDFFNPQNPKEAISNPTKVAAYLSGAFLAAGSVNNPHSRSYHLEIALKDEELAKFLTKLLVKRAPHRFSAKLSKRRKQHVVYMKKGDEISDFMVMIGAKDQCLQFEDVRISRDFSGIGNRLSNLDTANYGRLSVASKRQVEEINYLIDKEGKEPIEARNPKLFALMELRLKHQDASLEELSVLLSQELNTEISKSNINHLFRYIHSHTENLKNGND